MQFADTHLPSDRIFRDAFVAGWGRYVLRYAGDTARAAQEYLAGPVSLARLIVQHGGDCRQTAAAACLAGPAVFSLSPALHLHPRLLAFAQEVAHVAAAPAGETCRLVRGLSADARLFFQASAILLMEQTVRPLTGALPDAATIEKTYLDALQLYSAARGETDAYKLDTRFEIAAMKVTTFTAGGAQHIWRAPAAGVRRLSVPA